MEPADLGPWKNLIIGYGEEAPDQLLANPLNHRVHSRQQEEALEAVIDEAGFAMPIFVHRDSGFIVDGHLRVRLAMRRRIPSLPVAYLGGTLDDANLILATADRISAMAGIDDELQREMLAQLPGTEEVADILSKLDMTWGAGGRIDLGESSVEEEDVPPVPDEPETKHGDVWIMGDHRLVCGDCRDDEMVQRVTQGRGHHALWTDPPGPDGESRFEDMLRVAFANVEDVIVPGSPFYVAHLPARPGLVVGDILVELGWRIRQTLIWVMDSRLASRIEYRPQHQPIYFGYVPTGYIPTGVAVVDTPRVGRKGTHWFGDDEATTLFEYPRPKSAREHPTMKPIGLVAEQLRNSVSVGGLVYDPFAGSGTTMLACEQLGMTATMIEISAGACDIIKQRYETATGTAARLEKRNGKTDIAAAKQAHRTARRRLTETEHETAGDETTGV